MLVMVHHKHRDLEPKCGHNISLTAQGYLSDKPFFYVTRIVFFVKNSLLSLRAYKQTRWYVQGL